MKILVWWGAAVRPSLNTRSCLVGKRRQLRLLLNGADRVSEQEREAAKAKWRVPAAKLISKTAASTSAADRALVALQAVCNRFAGDPDQLTLEDVDKVVSGGLVKDVRCLMCAHGLLMLAERAGVFALRTGEEAKAHRVHIYEGIYEPVLHNVEPMYDGVVYAVIHNAFRLGLVADYPVPNITMWLSVLETLHGELAEVNRRVGKLEGGLDNLETASVQHHP